MNNGQKSLSVVALVLALMPVVSVDILLGGRTVVAQTLPETEPVTTDRLLAKGEAQFLRGQFRESVETFQQALAGYRQTNNQRQQGRTLTVLGQSYHSLGEYPPALKAVQQAVEIARKINDRVGEGRALNEWGVVQRKLANYTEAIALHQQAITLSRETGDRQNEGRSLNNLGVVYEQMGENLKALDIQQQALTIGRTIGDRVGEGRVLNSTGVVYFKLGQYDKALEYYQQALKIQQAIGDRAGEARTLGNIGVVYDSQGNYNGALIAYQQSLKLRRAIGDRAGESIILGNIGLGYSSLGQYGKALEYYQQALTIASQIGDRAGQGFLLVSLGTAYVELGDFARSLTYYQQALSLHRDIGDLTGTGQSLNSIGGVYENLGQYDKALEFYQQSLSVRRQVGDRAGEGLTLSNIGGIYDSLGQFSKALEFYQQALGIRREIGDRDGEGIILNNIGLIYAAGGNYPEALKYYQQALAIHQATGDRRSQGAVLNNLGLAYDRLKQETDALTFYQQALAIFREIGNRTGERLALNNIGSVLARQQKPELAIAFYKASVNVTETIRQDLKPLSRQEQESYTQLVANTYRALADLLLGQGRILAAQQVLELLKTQEIQEFTRHAGTLGQITVSDTEAKILQQHGTLIAFGQTVETCKQNRCAQLEQLNDQLQLLTQQYTETIHHYEAEIRRRRSADEAFLDPRKLAKLRDVVEAQPGTVLIYPLVLEDKIWLVWAARGGIVKSEQIPVSQDVLGRTVLQFRQEVQTITTNRQQLQATGKQLYDWLIKPLERELQANQIKNLVFALDRVTRYIPMSALFDGKKYLVETYTISTVLSADLTDMGERLPPGTQSTSILALGASEFKDLNPLPNVPQELAAIVRTTSSDRQGVYPGKEFLNQNFVFRTLRDNLLGHQILHIATHAAFVPGRPEDSYLVLGNGEKLTIPQIQTLQDLKDVHLVVLSACETALGGPDQDGVEISGISSYFLNSGTAAVLASLWSVDDSSTSQLMQQFYRNLATGTVQAPVTKTAALRQAQLSLIQGQASLTNASTRGIGVVQEPNSAGTRSNTTAEFSHPYYWAPFVLIGNGF